MQSPGKPEKALVEQAIPHSSQKNILFTKIVCL
jgi:hypothetical protein